MAVAILFSLAALARVAATAPPPPSPQSRVRRDLSELRWAVKMFRAQRGRYPTDLTELLQPSLGGPPYLNEIPKDPWDNDYTYDHWNGGFELVSWGADGVPGGADEARDWVASRLL
ncbi:MAG: type II secretion system protein GspG [Planctomycetota bacterium]